MEKIRKINGKETCNFIPADFDRVNKEQTGKPILELDLNKFDLAIDLNGMFRPLSKVFSNPLGREKIFKSVLPEKQRQSAMKSIFSAFTPINAFRFFLFPYQATITNPTPATPLPALLGFQSAALFSKFLALTKQSFQGLSCSASPLPRKNLKFPVLLDI